MILILLGIAGIGMGSMMYGDIGLAALIGGSTALLSGIGFFRLENKVKEFIS